jgi:hypothetical protein
MGLIIPLKRSEPFDDPACLFDLKLDGYRGVADTIAGRMLSKKGHRLRRFEPLLETLPAGYVFDGEIVALGEDGRPRFYDLMFGRREPVYVAFDLLFSEGEDVRALPLKERKACWRRWCAAIGSRTPSRCLARVSRHSRRCATSTWRVSLPSGWVMRTARKRRDGGKSRTRRTVRRKVGRSCLSVGTGKVSRGVFLGNKTEATW